MGKWIRIKDVEPTYGLDVLCSDGESFAVGFIDVYGSWQPANVDSGYDMAECFIDMAKITHWMPLPEPPGDA